MTNPLNSMIDDGKLELEARTHSTTRYMLTIATAPPPSRDLLLNEPVRCEETAAEPAALAEVSRIRPHPGLALSRRNQPR